MAGEHDIGGLAARVQRLEDERDIATLIASYGPAVDSADADAAAGLWAADGVYDVEGWRMIGSADVRAMVSSPSHRELVAAGCCHFLGPVVVTVDGDSAVAMCESLVLLRRAGPLPDSIFDHQAWTVSAQEYLVWRASANHFELARTASGWRIVRRTSRMLNGDSAAHDLLRKGLSGSPSGDVEEHTS
ncbi:nuclear transport factor 2 family protein [Mycolicibacterium neoaurum]|uniref:nuclear transport factor 2 family protein n=1 Tax=Mycolicibacterium neoaurum TaxID=1795 RepID=UPI00248AFDF5|nr:nuclear transport factor 2 family protein [Mycolicibacterium neoaurum]WBP94601.1 nuclear transport factor 2 family protein [Mycolicibacterium neoaurum]WBS08287.1 nuclear transport factor 2 family protein [Mycolicibacterium neoaurum]